MRVRVVDTRTLGDVKDGQTEPTPGPWFGYCEDCGTAILRRQGATVEREEAR
jgi:hypothetical protein